MVAKIFYDFCTMIKIIENKIDISAVIINLTGIILIMVTADLIGSLEKFSGPFIFQRNQWYNLCDGGWNSSLFKGSRIRNRRQCDLIMPFIRKGRRFDWPWLNAKIKLAFTCKKRQAIV